MGARADLATDPAVREYLLLARRGTAFFGRQVRLLRDDELSAPSTLPGRSRRWVLAEVALSARDLACALGTDEPRVFADAEDRRRQTAFATTLPAEALRVLVEHSAIHLSVAWRDLPPEDWHVARPRYDGVLLTPSERLSLRARQVWVRARQLDTGVPDHDLPVPFRGLARREDLE